MNTTLIEIRRAKPPDARAVAAAHDDAWRNAYQGIIPGPELDKLINRRGEGWWDGAIRKGSRVSILVFGEEIAGYANYGRNRARRGRGLRALPAAAIPRPRLRPQVVQFRAARSVPKRDEERGGLGFIRQ